MSHSTPDVVTVGFSLLLSVLIAFHYLRVALRLAIALMGMIHEDLVECTELASECTDLASGIWLLIKDSRIWLLIKEISRFFM